MAAAAAIPEPKATAMPPSSTPTACSRARQVSVPPSRAYSTAPPARKLDATTIGTLSGLPGVAGGRPAVIASVSRRSSSVVMWTSQAGPARAHEPGRADPTSRTCVRSRGMLLRVTVLHQPSMFDVLPDEAARPHLGPLELMTRTELSDTAWVD